MREELSRVVRGALESAVEAGDLPAEASRVDVVIERPRSPEHGDYATNLAMSLARVARRAPRDIAAVLLRHLPVDGRPVASAEMAGPGFLNLRLADDAVYDVVRKVRARGVGYGRAEAGTGPRVLVEFVSANPTGPLHVGHGRGAVVGDALASLLEAAGYRVDREYYVNDVGNQMQMLARSLHARVQQAHGLDVPLPESGYKGAYLAAIAADFLAEHGDRYRGVAFEEAAELFLDFAKDTILEGIRRDLGALRIDYDAWFPESRLHEEGKVQGVIDALRERGIIYEQDGALRFRTTDYGDDDDRVVVRADGRPTYFAADIAYHKDKFDRGYDLAINIWGADHHGYIPRVRAALQAVGVEPERLEVLLIQFVGLLRNGVQVKMSTRSGEFEELSAVVDEVGPDAARFLFLLRRPDSQQDFDLEVAKKRSMDNPVFYVQYGHARLCSILRRAAEAGVEIPSAGSSAGSSAGLDALTLPEERELMLAIGELPHVLRRAAEAREPHQITFYLVETIKAFHGYYTRYKHSERVLSDDPVKTAGRLALVDALRQVIANGLGLLKVHAPERMDPPAEEAEEAGEAGEASEA